jgi:hypothetical protein
LNELFILFIGRYLFVNDHAPDLIEEVLAVVGKVLVELELIHVDQAHHLGPALD